MEIKPHKLLWTFGNHEPISMYRRIGKNSTGGLRGNALWLEKWHNSYDSEECVKTMADMGFNILHCRFYKGLGWDFEKEDFPAVANFARLCRKYSIKVLAYVQAGSVYPEVMKKEIPDLEDWCQRHYDGSIGRYFSSYWRYMPCTNSREFSDYIKKILDIMIDSELFDGVIFDNVFSFPCYCPRCRKLFVEHLKKCNYNFIYPEFVEMPPEIEEKPDDEIFDPIRQEFIRFRQASLTNLMQGFYEYIKSRNPDMLVTANFPLLIRHVSGPWFCQDITRLIKTVDLLVGQSGNEPRIFDDGSVISQTGELKMSHALNTPTLVLNDSDAAGDSSVDSRYVAALFEALSGGGIPVDRVVMKPERGGKLNQQRVEQRKAILARLKEIADKYDDIFSMKEYTPVALLYSQESIDFSKASQESYLKVLESLMRSQVQFKVIASNRNGIIGGVPEDCSTIIVPEARCLSDKVIGELKSFKGKLVLAGKLSGDFDENYCEREASPFENFPCEIISVPDYTVLSASWITRLRPAENQQQLSFGGDISLEFAPEVRSVCKHDGNKIRAVLLSAVKETGAGKIEFAANTAPKRITAVSLEGEKQFEVSGNSFEVPPFGGMLLRMVD